MGKFPLVPGVGVLARPDDRAYWPLTAGFGWSYALLLGSIVANVAAIACLGLALATWVSRLGRAVALCVTIYLGFTIGWMVLIAQLGPPGPVTIPLIAGSPFYGTLLATVDVMKERMGPSACGEYPARDVRLGADPPRVRRRSVRGNAVNVQSLPGPAVRRTGDPAVPPDEARVSHILPSRRVGPSVPRAPESRLSMAKLTTPACRAGPGRGRRAGAAV